MAREAGKRNHIADVFHPCGKLDEAFKTGAKSGVRHSPVLS